MNGVFEDYLKKTCGKGSKFPWCECGGYAA